MKRLLGLHIQEGRDKDYGKAFALAQSVGVGFVPLSFDWSRIETAPGQFTSPLPKIANQFYPAQRMPVFLILRPINTVKREVPADLKGVAWDETQMCTRFRAFLDSVLDDMRDVTLVGIAIGNELSTVLSAEKDGWRTYSVFLRDIRDYLRTKRPGVPVGVPIAYSDLVDAIFQRETQALNTLTDGVFVTYYPLQKDFTVRLPDSPRVDFERLRRVYPNKPIHFVEAGYPSSPDCKSGEAKQARFIESVFALWDTNKEQIPTIAFSWQTDHSPAEVDELTRYYTVPGAGFRGFLSSLGLRTWEGRSKPAWEILANKAKASGFLPFYRKTCLIPNSG